MIGVGLMDRVLMTLVDVLTLGACGRIIPGVLTVLAPKVRLPAGGRDGLVIVVVMVVGAL